MEPTLSSEEAKTLFSLCRAGKLYQIEEWVTAGRSLRVPQECKKSPLQLAIEAGFHSLVELLVRHETCQAVKDRALADALKERRLDLVELLVSHGADVKAVPFLIALQSWDPAIIRFMLSHGADAISDSPFAYAFSERIRTALRPFMEYKESHPELASRLREEADCALRYFSKQENFRWISLMMWAGASPRTPGPMLYEGNDPDCYTSALQEACYAGKLEVLKKLKPEAGRGDLSDLLGCAALLARTDVVHYLLEIGANPNDKQNGGSSALDHCVLHIGFEGIHSKQQKSKHDVYRTFDCLRELLEHSAFWKPDDSNQINSVRRTLYGCEPLVTVELLQLFVKNNSASQDIMQELLQAPRMNQHLSGVEGRLSRLKLTLTSQPPKRKAITARLRAGIPS
jgi:ankyrin repeat protein